MEYIIKNLQGSLNNQKLNFYETQELGKRATSTHIKSSSFQLSVLRVYQAEPPDLEVLAQMVAKVPTRVAVVEEGRAEPKDIEEYNEQYENIIQVRSRLRFAHTV